MACEHHQDIINQLEDHIASLVDMRDSNLNCDWEEIQSYQANIASIQIQCSISSDIKICNQAIAELTND